MKLLFAVATVLVIRDAIATTCAPISTITITATCSIKTKTKTVTDTVTAPATVETKTRTKTVTKSAPRKTETETITASASTTTATATVTATTTVAPTNENIDQSGCPAIDGDTIDEFVIQCGYTADATSYAYARRPGYNIEDCASQCYEDPDNVDCLGVVYTAPSPTFGGYYDNLEPGTCTFYEFIDSTLPSPGNDVAGFDGLGLSKRDMTKKIRRRG